MTFPSRKALAILASAMIAGTMSFSALAQGQSGGSGTRYQVDITNLTHAQQFTPLLLVTHRPEFKLFTYGDPASPQLETLAEEGNVGPLRDSLQAQPQVSSVTAGTGLTAPGSHATFQIRANFAHDRLSIAAMLIPTNDAFMSLSGGSLPLPNKSATYYLYANDAGTERNDERCASIPGPNFAECGGPGQGGAPSGGEEGFVHIHNGIHGVGDLDAAERDWRGPVAKVVITSAP
ncbi:MAG: spondin domain-containing protein [Thermomonas sp.]